MCSGVLCDNFWHSSFLLFLFLAGTYVDGSMHWVFIKVPYLMVTCFSGFSFSYCSVYQSMNSMNLSPLLFYPSLPLHFS